MDCRLEEKGGGLFIKAGCVPPLEVAQRPSCPPKYARPFTFHSSSTLPPHLQASGADLPRGLA